MASGYKTSDGKDLDERYAAPSETMVTGMVVAFAASNVPTGYLLCNGAAISRKTYANLFDVIGIIYGGGDGSSTFNLPNLTERFVEGHTTAGMVREAGLPNITGHHGGHAFKYGDYTDVGGAFIGTNTRNGGAGEDGNITQVYVTKFDASRCSAVYGKSSTVQPASVTMRYYIKY